MAAATRRWCALRLPCAPPIPVFEPQAPALAALSARLKEQFDPKGILNPGRMAPGSSSATLGPATEGTIP